MSAVTVTVDDVDRSCDAYSPLTISWGRDHPGEGFEPRRCVASFLADGAPSRGQRLRVVLNSPTANPTWDTVTGPWSTYPGTWLSTRAVVVLFDGRVTDTTTSWVPIIAHTKWAVAIDVVAVDPVADLSRLPVGDTPFPQETVSARAARIEALTPLTWTTDPSAALVAARDVDSQPALELLDDLAHQASLAGGIFFDPNTYVARFLLDAMRGSRDAQLFLSGCDILSGAERVEAVADIVNDVTVTYVNPADTSSQPSSRAQYPASITANGRRNKTISTALVTPADATKRANTEVERFGVLAPRWTAVTVTRDTITAPGIAEQILAAGPGLRLRLTELPPPAETEWDGYLEGWSLTLAADDWSAELQLSPATWSGPLLSWADAVKPSGATANPNPGFEATPWVAGWSTFWRAGSNQTSVTVTHDTPWEGLNACRVSSFESRPDNARRIQTLQPIAVAPGQVWQMNGYARSSVAGAGIGYGAVGAPPGGTPDYFGPGSVGFGEAGSYAVPSDGLWHAFSRTVTVPAGVTTARFDALTRPGPGSFVDIDNVRFSLPGNVGAWSDVVPTWRWMDATAEIYWATP